MTATRCAAFIDGVQRDAPITVKQVYAIAAALCKSRGEQFPTSRAKASDLIERLRKESA